MRVDGRLRNGVRYWGHANRDKGENSHRGWIHTHLGNSDTGEGFKELREYHYQFVWGRKCSTLGGEVERNSHFSDSNGGLSGHFGIPYVFTLYWGVTNAFSDTHRDPARTWGFRWMVGGMGPLGTISIDWDKRETCYQEEVERKGSFHRWIDVADALLGQARVYQADAYHHERGFVYIAMPEGLYIVEVAKERRAWIRPRWPIPKLSASWGVDAGFRDNKKYGSQWGIPAPSRKHEDDGLCATGFSAEKYPTIEDAARAFGERVAADRIKYGSGLNWRPAKDITVKDIDPKIPIVTPNWAVLQKEHEWQRAEELARGY